MGAGGDKARKIKSMGTRHDKTTIGGENEYVVRVTRRFIAALLLSSILTAFAGGQLARRTILTQVRHQVQQLSSLKQIQDLEQTVYASLARTMLLESRARRRRESTPSSSSISSRSSSSSSAERKQCNAMETPDTSSEYLYYESLVHPALFTHEDPKRVGIITSGSSGRDGVSTDATGSASVLHQVLKHTTVEHAVVAVLMDHPSNHSQTRRQLIETYNDPRIDAIVVNTSDPIDKFMTSSFFKNDGNDDGRFDVIFVDLNLEQHLPSSENGGSRLFLKTVVNAISKDGIFVIQIGKTDTLLSSSFSSSRNVKKSHLSSLRFGRSEIVEILINENFESIRTYEVNGYRFSHRPWEFLIAFKDFDSRAGWFANSALVDLNIRKRTIFEKVHPDDDLPFQTFDGASMQTLLYPSKASENIFCQENHENKACKNGHGFDPERVNLPASATVEVKQSSLGPKAGRGVFAKVDIPRLSYVGLDVLVPVIHFDPQAYRMVTDFYRVPPFTYYDYYSEYWGVSLETYIHGYGHLSSYRGLEDVYVDSTFHCFVNHACNGTNNVGHDLNLTEANTDPSKIPPELRRMFMGGDLIYNPAAERQVHFYSSAVPLRDIQKGEEIFDNYLGMSGLRIQGWEDDVLTLRAQCEGIGIGQISQYEGL